jgi:hypothetical protein
MQVKVAEKEWEKGREQRVTSWREYMEQKPGTVWVGECMPVMVRELGLAMVGRAVCRVGCRHGLG